VGTLAAVAGAVTILENYNRPDYEVGFFVGGLLVHAGLLLRIKAAISARGNADR
jgi:hypothetical protein